MRNVIRIFITSAKLAAALKPKRLIFSTVTASLLIYVLLKYTWNGSPPQRQQLPESMSSSEISLPLTSQPFPRKIWQSWRDDSADPTPRAAGLPHLWREINPSYRYERITDDSLDTYVNDRFQSEPEVAAFISGLSDNILKADILRYLLMYREGGVWADIDVKPIKPIEEWIPKKYRGKVNVVVGIENDHHKSRIWPDVPYSVQLCQYSMMWKPNHPLMKIVYEQSIRNVKQLLAGKEDMTVAFDEVMRATGPFSFTKALMDYFEAQTGEPHNGDDFDDLEEPVLIGDVLLLPRISFGMLASDDLDQEEHDRAVLVEHLFIGSWLDTHSGLIR